MTVENLKKRLLSHDIRPSKPRVAILKYLIEHRTHPNVDSIYQALAPEISSLSKTTVYNTVDLFSEHGVIQRLTIDDKTTNYDADTSVHPHFLCQVCGAIYDMPEVTDLSALPDAGPHELHDIQIYYRGICAKCKDSKKAYS